MSGDLTDGERMRLAEVLALLNKTPRKSRALIVAHVCRQELADARADGLEEAAEILKRREQASVKAESFCDSPQVAITEALSRALGEVRERAEAVRKGET